MSQAREEVEAQINAVVVEQSRLTDSNESAIAGSTSGSVARQIVAVQTSVDGLYASYGFGGSGQNLRDRCGQLAGFVVDVPASPAQGAVLQFTRNSSVGELVVPAGSLVQTQLGVVYSLAVSVTFLDGSLVYPATGQPYGYAIATVPGLTGNCGGGTITQTRSVPDGVIGVTNPIPLANGLPAETDEQLRYRAFQFVAAGLSRTTAPALIYLALTFVASDGTRCRHATVWRDPTRPYAKLIVSDGQGFAGLQRPATLTTTTVPVNGVLGLIPFDAPAVEDEITVEVNGSAVTPPQWVVRGESGVAIVDQAQTFAVAGDTIVAAPANVYTGFLAELQGVVNGDTQFLGTNQGWRAEATRVVVAPPNAESLELSVLVVYAPGPVEPEAINASIRTAIVEYFLALPIGAPLLVVDLISVLNTLPYIVNFRLVDTDDPTVAQGDVYPSSPLSSLTTQTYLIRVNGSLA